ncbi:MAG: M20/M25/M40 family metallo-hydrolase [Dokdonella sp.]
MTTRHPVLATLCVLAMVLSPLAQAVEREHAETGSSSWIGVDYLAHPEAGNPPVFIVTARTTYVAIQSLIHNARAKRDSLGTDLVIGEVRADQVDQISHYVHETERRCGGFFAFSSRAEAEAFLAADRSAMATLARRVDPYTIDNQITVDAWLPQVSHAAIHATIAQLSSYQNRYYSSSYGRQSALWIRDTWAALAAGRADASASLFEACSNCSTQPSVILTVQGSELPDEVVVIGGHLDSISNASGGNERRAPGADDDASGIATITEMIRIAMASGWKPKRTVKFMGYAAEEVGLYGSNAIAQQFKADQVDVVGVLQLDMTNYKNGAPADMRIVTDHSNSALKLFMAEVFDHYLAPLGLTRGTETCGYGCSDHASWTAAGFPAGMMFEAGNASGGSFPYIHSINDTLANMSDSAVNSAKFARFGLAFLGELAKTHAEWPSDVIFRDGFEMP